jgi:hypothetical protein
MGLDIVEMIMEVEAQFGIEVSDRDASRLRTVGDWYWYLRERLDAQDAPQYVSASADPIWERLLRILEKATGLAREHLRADAELIRDLGMG